MCTCLDRRMFLEFLVALQARRIAELHADTKVGPITYLQGPCPACAAGHVLHTETTVQEREERARQYWQEYLDERQVH